MKSISIYSPAKLVFGIGCISQFADDCLQLGFKKLFIISSSAILPFLNDIIRKLEEAAVQVEIFHELKGEPTFAQFEGILNKAKIFNADSVAGIGGGSVMDAAKLLAAQLRNSQDTKSVVGNGLLKERKTYLACIPTTSGTGSEVSPNAIFLDETDKSKKGVISPFLVPDASYVDPGLTVSMPPFITATTGLDALVHCIEAYVNVNAHPMIDLYALEGMRLISGNLLKAVLNGQDQEARSNVALGSMYGGICLGPVNTAAVHALAYPLGSMFHFSHGLSTALLLPYVMEFNLHASLSRYANVAVALGASPGRTDEETAIEGISIIRNLIRECKIPYRLLALNIPEESIETMALSALQVQRLLKNNVREIGLEQAIEIYKTAY